MLTPGTCRSSSSLILCPVHPTRLQHRICLGRGSENAGCDTAQAFLLRGPDPTTGAQLASISLPMALRQRWGLSGHAGGGSKTSWVVSVLCSCSYISNRKQGEAKPHLNTASVHPEADAWGVEEAPAWKSGGRGPAWVLLAPGWLLPTRRLLPGPAPEGGQPRALWVAQGWCGGAQSSREKTLCFCSRWPQELSWSNCLPASLPGLNLSLAACDAETFED